VAGRRPQWIPARTDLPGIALAAVVAAAALGLTRALPRSPWISDVFVALVLGMVVLNSPLRRLIRLDLPGADRDPDRWAAGLRFTGKWILRLGIILMGLQVQTSFFGGTELALIGGVALATLPSTFFVTHALGGGMALRRPLSDLVAAGTMICGASAVNAVAPVARARREEQGIAIAVIFLFSVVALVAFRPVAQALGLPSAAAGLWSGLAVNDLSSAIAVGAQMGGEGGVMAAAAKSARILLLAPLLVALSLVRREGRPVDVRQGIVEALPRFLLGYVGLALVRIAGDRWLGDAAGWSEVVGAGKASVHFLMMTVTAGIGLHLGIRGLVRTSPRAIVVGGVASLWMAALSLGMITAAARGTPAMSALVGVIAVLVAYALFRVTTRDELRERRLLARFEGGAPLSLAEATQLLAVREAEGPLDETFLRRLLVQTHPSIGELIPVRESPLPHGQGCRWRTFWQGAGGWALVAISREAGSATPIHAHPHRLLGKTLEGVLEELRFREHPEGELELASRAVLAHEELVETEALATIHVVRVAGSRPAIDLQLRGPEIGRPGRVLRTRERLDLERLAVGSRLVVTEEIDRRPGHGGEGAAAGWVTEPPRA
jgi:uncharacterized integral membrane protein (TIGR00698 family)